MLQLPQGALEDTDSVALGNVLFWAEKTLSQLGTKAEGREEAREKRLGKIGLGLGLRDPALLTREG